MWSLISFVLSGIQGHLLLLNNFIGCQSNFTVSLKTVSSKLLSQLFSSFHCETYGTTYNHPENRFLGVPQYYLFLMLGGDEALQKCTIKRIQYNQTIRCHFSETATKVGQC